MFSTEKPINPIGEHYIYCPISDKKQPLWKDLYQQQTETKEVNKSMAGKFAILRSTLFDALADKIEWLFFIKVSNLINVRTNRKTI